MLLPAALAVAVSGCQSLATKPDPGNGADASTTPFETPGATAEGPAVKPLPQARRPPRPPQTALAETSPADVRDPDGALRPADLWERVRGGFRLQIPDNSRVDHELKWYTEHPEYLQRVQERARPYLHFIVEQAERRNIPSEIALLPAVESAFQPLARSPSQAAGIWQFIPATGRALGLRQTWWYDGRRDIVASTQAALDYLSILVERFDGDWELALAAYNSGAGTVSRAIKRNLSQGKPTDYWSLDLPQETQHYVPRLLALVRLVADPQQHGIQIAAIPNTPYFASVEIGDQLDLTVAAELAATEIDELHLLNPGFKRWASDPNGPHELQLPIATAPVFRERLAQLPAEQRMHWKRYRIRTGDSLSAIAQRHLTSVAVLQQVNRLQGARIRAGSHLLIPVEDPQTIARTEKHRAKDEQTLYVVRPGDTLWDIGRAHQLDHQQLAEWNSISFADSLRPGTTLVLWEGTGRPQTRTGSKHGTLPARLDLHSTTAKTPVRYQVRRGDSLYSIAHRYKVSIADLKRWNHLAHSRLHPGQKLRIYVQPSVQKML